MSHAPADIITFWFHEVGAARWFDQDPALDALIGERFLALHEQAASGALNDWQATPEGMLGLMLLLDQFPRRLFRGTSRAFDTETQAVDLARTAIVKRYDEKIAAEYKLLFYLPFLNSESEGNQRLALFYIRERVKENRWLDLAEERFETVQRFGRFPDRNPILGREPTADETAFVARRASGQA